MVRAFIVNINNNMEITTYAYLNICSSENYFSNSIVSKKGIYLKYVNETVYIEEIIELFYGERPSKRRDFPTSLHVPLLTLDSLHLQA